MTLPYEPERSSAWPHSHGRAAHFSREHDFGCVWTNTHLPFVSEMPHSGFGISGYGKDVSGYLFGDYTRIKHLISTHF